MKIVSTFPPTIVNSRAEIAGFLQGLREAAGMTCEAFDYHAGFSDRYVSKMEHGDKPQGRQGFYISPGRIGMSAMAEVWLDALGVALVLMDLDQAAAIGAVPCPPRPPEEPRRRRSKAITPPGLEPATQPWASMPTPAPYAPALH